MQVFCKKSLNIYNTCIIYIYIYKLMPSVLLKYLTLLGSTVVIGTQVNALGVYLPERIIN